MWLLVYFGILWYIWYISVYWVYLGIFETKRVCSPEHFTTIKDKFYTDISVRSLTNYSCLDQKATNVARVREERYKPGILLMKGQGLYMGTFVGYFGQP